MSDVHARPPVPPVEGRCTWRHHYEDVDLACDDVVVFGEVYCTDHLDPTRVAGDDGKHKCPYAPCERRVPMHLFACRAQGGEQLTCRGPGVVTPRRPIRRHCAWRGCRALTRAR
jgi:hypothetical protein